MPTTPPILFVAGNEDDSTILRSPVLRSLADAGYSVISATEHDTAISLAQQHNPGLILIGDISRDGDNTFHLLHQLAAHQASQALQAANAHPLELLVNNLPGMAYRCKNDRNWTMLFVSAGAEQLTGYRADELTGGSQQIFADLLHPDDRQHVWENVQTALAMGQAYSLVYRITTRQGIIKWVWEQGFPSRKSSDGELVLDGFISDISQQKWYEDELAKLHREQALILEATSEGIFGIDAQGRCNFINRAGARMLGYASDTLIGSDIHRLIHPDCTEQHCPLCGSSQQGESQRASEDWFQRHDGTALPVSWSVQTLHNAGIISGAVITFSDITERKQQQDQVRFNEERFRYIVQATHDAIWDINLASGDTWWNDGIQKLLGVTPTSNNTESQSLWINGIHPDDREKVLASFNNSITGSSNIWEAEYRFVRVDNGIISVRARGFIVRDSNGTAVRILGGMTDISQELLMQERLQQSQRLEAIGQLTGGVAHDFNNLLTVILGNNQLLEEELHDNPRLQTLAKMSASAAQRGAELTQRLLAFARRQALEPSAVDINRLVGEVDGLLRHTLKQNIDIELVRGGGLWNALVDPSQLEGALLNLAINARDAMPNGGRLTIETANMYLDEEYAANHGEVAAGRYVMLAMSDTGTGIPQDILPKVFDPFFTTKEKGKGTGLGLSMVYGFVKQSNGHIKIYSEEGVGTTIRIYLPLASAADKPAEPVVKRADYTTGSETILLVEDDDLVRNHVANMLQNLGYNVLIAANGHQAVDIIGQSVPIDLLFTDIIMPAGMNGRELADIACGLRPGLRVLFTSGYTENAIVHHGRLDQGVSLLSKPYRRAELAKKIRLVLDAPG